MAMIYLNNAATSWPKPDCVANAVANAIRALPGHSHRAGGPELQNELDCRALLARLLGVRQPDRIALGCNATHALNVALHGFPFSPDDVVLSTAAEHNSVLRPLFLLEKQGRIKKTVYLPTDACGRVELDAWAKAVREHKPKLAVFIHASNVTGAVNDAQAMTAIARQAGAMVLLDASQSLGAVPVLPEAWGIDMVAFTGHKYLLGPQGTGGLYVREGLNLRPVWVGGVGIHSDADEMPEEMPLRLEAGTPNEPAYLGLAAALDWAEKNPPDFAALDALVQYASDGLSAAGAQVVQARAPRTPVLTFLLPGYPPEDVGEMLQGSFDIICRTGLHCAPHIHAQIGSAPQGSVRVSLSRFTTKEEVDELIDAVRQIME